MVDISDIHFRDRIYQEPNTTINAIMTKHMQKYITNLAFIRVIKDFMGISDVVAIKKITDIPEAVQGINVIKAIMISDISVIL